MSPPLSLLALVLALATSSALAQATAGSFVEGGNTKISAMMMFVGNEEKVYILDKAEGNAERINGHPAWGGVWDMGTHETTVMDVRTNVFCASGMHLPNGSFVTFGGNKAVGRGGDPGSLPNDEGGSAWDAEYQDFDGGRAIRVLNPCTSSDNFASTECQWFDDPDVLSMQKRRWYSAAEPLADGRIVLIGGFVNGGYVNRNYPNIEPDIEGGAAEPTYEIFPSNGEPPKVMNFMIKTSGLNSYAHAFLMPSGKMFVQANISTTLWDPIANQETDLPDMPKNIARVYPASGAVAMLPLTPANNYNPTILFCGGSDMDEYAYGDYGGPYINTWEYPASKDCQRITPEPTDGSAPVYKQDDDMLEGRTMGQFITLPDGKLLVINGGLNGTAGYAENTPTTPSYSDMPFGMSLASGPVGTPAIYDPNAPAGSRWSNAGLGTSNIARLYHSSAILLPDASVLVAGSNPNVDVNLTTAFQTEYRAEIFYPPYFSATTRPVPSGIPKTISYGGNPFDISIPVSSYSGIANDAAEKTTITLLRPGFTTHAMNMGQRHLQLNNTYTVKSDGSITFHVAQAPPNPNIFQPGPALLFVSVNGVPSNGTLVIVGNEQVGQQPTAAVSSLPPSIRLDSVTGSADGSTTGNNDSNNNSNGAKSNTGKLVAGVVGAIAVIGILGALIGIFIVRRRRAANRAPPSAAYAMRSTMGGAGGVGGGAAAAYGGARGMQSSDSSAFVPLQQDNHSQAWNASTVSLTGPYHDNAPPGRAIGNGLSMDDDPYASSLQMNMPAGAQHRY